ncbi:R3H domain-containing nucleic acid-binding protein [Alkalinema sp. FACHB-956]|uniref:Jag family protein n=1 Tax=Alkalinema sp. FACHB-956 TaxID=2692768 RepID=UPI0016850B1B|nr:R3H domain-containing nucleic acid-binding protein [Alkalinema sp. FACHB-956]MBD2326584.1 RNA-binding protein [Alkalinema sp. FACHB-956]
MGNHPSQERGQQWLAQILKLATLDASVVSEMVQTDDEHNCWLTIVADHLSPEQKTALVGERGQVLDSLQYLANATLNIGQSEDAQGAYILELEGYRKQRSQQLRVIVEEAVAAVRETGQDFEIKSLSSAERREVHGLLKHYEELENFSRGQEPDRRLVVRLKTTAAE